MTTIHNEKPDHVRHTSSDFSLRNKSEYEALMDLSGVAIAKIDLETFQAVEYNDAVCKILGVTREQCEALFHHNLNEIFTTQYRGILDQLKAKIEDTLTKKEASFTIDMQMPTINGTTWVNGSVSFQQYDSKTGRPKYLVTVYRDISEVVEAREKQEQAKRNQEEMAGMKRLIEAVPAGIGTIHIHDHKSEPDYIQLNQHFLNHVAVKANDMGMVTMHDFAQCILPEERDQFRSDCYNFFNIGFKRGRIYRLLLKNGQYAWFNIQASIRTLAKDNEILYFVFTNITEQKQAAALLKENQRHYQKTVDDLQIRMWTYDIVNKRIVMGDNIATESFLKKNCLPRVFENVPESMFDLIKEEDRPSLLHAFEEIKKGHDVSCDLWYKQRPGIEPTCQRVSYHVIKDSSGRAIKAYGIGRNITTEKNLQEQYAREMEYMHNNSDESLLAKGHCNLTQDCIIDYENCLTHPTLGYHSGMSFDEAVQTVLNVARNEEEKTEIAEKLSRERLIERLRNGEPQSSFQFRKTTFDNDTMWISVNMHTFTSPLSGEVEMFAYAYDITEKKMIETVMNMVSQYGIDFIGTINVHNNTIEFLRKAPYLKFPQIHQKINFDDYRKYAISHNLKDTEMDYTYEVTDIKHIIRLLETPVSHTVTFLLNEDGRTHCKQLDLMWFDPDKTTILIVRTDVTPSYDRDQQQLAKIEASKLAAVQANEAKSTFLSSMSHDLRTPLNGVIGFTNLALQETDLEKKQDYLKKINSSAGLLLDLVNDTLELSRIESGKAVLNEEAVNEKDLVPAVVASLRPAAELKQIKIQTDYSMMEGKVFWCDKLKVEKIALNLLSNAIKYTPEGGTISLGFIKGPEDMPACQWSMYIEDNGIGMSKAFLKHMFEPFSQEKRAEARKTQGTGLGLSIVKKYVDLMNGRIEVKSTLHKGTRWVISLPITCVAEAETRRKKTKKKEANLVNKRVLLCEDNDMNTEIAKMILQEKGILCDTAANGKEGLEKFKASRPGTYDVILMDLCMPVMDGLTAAKKIRACKRKDAGTVPIIAMTADVFENSIKEAKAAGMNAYVTKPVNPPALYHTLEEMILGTETKPAKKKSLSHREQL